ncbi:hypothetical protein SLS56_002450 [Neofusicoccum ribis]|uniref:Pectate lyase n=1 Tax=Neofusicoccum ribis TaxID=45134 RepID=A0ABR3T4C5_9PEZI
MQFKYAALAAAMASMVSGQALAIPKSNGKEIIKGAPRPLSGFNDMNFKEFDRGQPCNSDKDQGSNTAVFVLANGATLQNVIIGADAFEGIHCEGACTLKNVWFRDVCEDAITLKGSGAVLIEGGGAQNAVDKVIQHNGRGTTTIRNFQVSNVGKLFRSCGDCSNNGGPRNVVVDRVRAFGMKSDLVGINSNFGDTATVTNSCGSSKLVCQEFKGVQKGQGESPKLKTNTKCLGAQGKLQALPAC